MKLLIGGTAVAMLLAGAAFAQTEPAAPVAPAANSQCADVGSEPTLPDGTSANNRAMMAGDTAYQAWAQTARASLQCRRSELDLLRAREQALVEESNTLAARVNGLSERWVASRTAYCDRDGVECTQN